MYGVHAIGIGVIGKARGAADAGDNYDIFPRHANLRQYLLHLRKYGIIAAPGAPADFLISLEILCSKGSRRGRVFRHERMSYLKQKSACGIPEVFKEGAANLQNRYRRPLWILPMARIFLLNRDHMKSILLALFALCCLSATALGKGRSLLSGKVTDADGKGLVTASISLQKTFGAPIVKVVATGAYMFPNLDSGEYSAFVTAQAMSHNVLPVSLRAGKSWPWIFS